MVDNMVYNYRKGIQAVVYRNNDSKREFLILHRVKNWEGWEFLKGGVEKDELYRNAVIRELWEECNCKKEEILNIWQTRQNFIIEYPEKSQKESGYKGTINKTFIVELNSNASLNVDNNIEIEHDRLDWVTTENAKRLLHPRLAESLEKTIKILESYNRASKYGLEIKRKFGKRLDSVLLYGSKTLGNDKEKSDFDIALVLKTKSDEDVELIKSLNNEWARFDLNILYLDDLFTNADVFSWDSSGPLFYYVLRDSSSIIGKNPFDSMTPPTKEILDISILAKMQYYVFKIRRATFQSKSEQKNDYFLRRIPPIMRMLILLKDQWYEDEGDAIKNFEQFYSDYFSSEELNNLKKILNEETCSVEQLYVYYNRFYSICVQHLKEKRNLATLYDSPIRW